MLFDHRQTIFELRDIDGDGFEDMVSVEHVSILARRWEVTWRQRDPWSASFRDELNRVRLQNEQRSTVFRDLDGDGDIDILAASPRDIGWYETGSREQHDGETTSQEPPRLTADANDDGIVDFFDFLPIAEQLWVHGRGSYQRRN